MDIEFLLPLLKKNPLFQNLTDEQILLILKVSKEINVPQGGYIIREGEKRNEVYLMIQGSAEVTKKDETTGIEHAISVLKIEEVFGEQSLIDKSPRSASVRALENSKVLELHLFEFSLHANQKPVFAQCIINITETLSERLRKTSDLTVKTLQEKLKSEEDLLEVGRFLFSMLFLLSIWIFLVDEMQRITTSAKATSLITFPMIIILVTLCIIYVKVSRYPLSFFGLNFKNWKKDVLEGIIFSIPLLILATLFKWLLVLYVPKFHNEPVIMTQLTHFKLNVSPWLQILGAAIYILLTPIQEFVARGVLQSSIKAFLPNFRTPFWSIILSNIIFAAFHAHISALYALAAFMGGCMWGWIYSRQWSLVGPCVSHALVGLWCIVLLQYGKLFATI